MIEDRTPEGTPEEVVDKAEGRPKAWRVGGEIYPVTIIQTRYGGAYESGKWAAFHLDWEDIPDAATGDDGEASAFWGGRGGRDVGRGATPDEALADLEKRLA